MIIIYTYYQDSSCHIVHNKKNKSFVFYGDPANMLKGIPKSVLLKYLEISEEWTR